MFASAFVFQAAFDSAVTSWYETHNKGKLWKDVKLKLAETGEDDEDDDEWAKIWVSLVSSDFIYCYELWKKLLYGIMLASLRKPHYLLYLKNSDDVHV